MLLWFITLLTFNQLLTSLYGIQLAALPLWLFVPSQGSASTRLVTTVALWSESVFK